MERKRSKSLPRKTWSFLAYIAGDNNLSDAGLVDIQEMADAGASPQVHCGVQMDTKGEHDGSIRYEITEPDSTGTAHRTVIERLPESDSGAPETLLRFLKWGFKRYPADHRLVVVWNHGSGFRTYRRERVKDIAFDDYGSSLDIPELERALKRAGATPQHRVTILGLDACLMNMVEIVHHLRSRVEIVVGSEQTEPNDGWPYDKVLGDMKHGGTPKVIARKIVERYVKSYRAAGDEDVTQSAVVTEATDDIVMALGELGHALAQGAAGWHAPLRGVRTRVQSYEDYPDYVDLTDLAGMIRKKISDADIKTLARDVTTTTAAAVFANGKYGRGVRGSHGLSVWFPADRTTYINFRGKYLALDATRRHRGWGGVPRRLPRVVPAAGARRSGGALTAGATSRSSATATAHPSPSSSSDARPERRCPCRRASSSSRV